MSEDNLEQWKKANVLLVRWFEHCGLKESKYHVQHCCEEGEQIKEWFVQMETVDILLTLVSTSVAVMLQARAALFEVSQCNSKEELYEHLLELNASELSCCAFGIEEDEVVVVSDRPMTNVDLPEITRMIQAILDTVHEYKDIVQSKG